MVVARLAALGGIVLGIGLGSAAQAATVTYTNGYAGPTDVSNQGILLEQFNPTLGTLISASFTLSATMNTAAFATNDGDFRAGWDKLQYDLSLVGSAPYSSIAISASAPATRIVGTGVADGDFTLGEMLQIIGQPAWSYSGPTLSIGPTVFAPGPLAPFIGTGSLMFLLTTVNFDALSVLAVQTAGLPSPAPFGLTTNVLADVAVTYTYAVPEADTWAMMFAGLGVLGLAVRRAGWKSS